MSYVEIWKARKKREDAERAKRAEKADKREAGDKEAIRSYLKDNGVEEVSTNGYWYQFECAGLAVSFVNQTSRLVGQIHRPLVNKDEEDCVRDCSSRLMHGGDNREKEMFVEEFNYREFVFNGKAKRMIRRVLRLAEEVGHV